MRILSCLLPFLVAPLAFAQALRPGPPDVVTIQTRDFQVEFTGDRAWTFLRILYKGEIVTDKTGYYGTVFSAEGGKWIGTGHNDGGIELVKEVKLTVDGKTCGLTDKAVYKGQRAVLEKQSMLGPLKLHATYIVTDDAILERHQYEVTEDVKIGTLYAFMHPWIPATTGWMAQMPDGSVLDGKFDNSGDFKLKADPKWTAIYNPASKRAMLLWYPKPLAGQGIKTGYWDKTVYHKLYNQIYSHASVAKGAAFEAAVIVRGVESDEDKWKTAAKDLATDTAAAFDRRALGF